MIVPVKTFEEMTKKERREYLEGLIEGSIFADHDGNVHTFEELISLEAYQKWEWIEPTMGGDGAQIVKPGPGDDPNNLNTKWDYSCAELGALWNWHRDTVAYYFKDYPGIIETPTSHSATRSKRAYRTFRIPGEVAMKWRREHTKK